MDIHIHGRFCSGLPPNSPTIGLLYGHTNTNTNTDGGDGNRNRNLNRNHETETQITIIDAEEVETSANPSTLQESQLAHIRIKIELHQKVFPNHEVVGWYRVKANGNGNGNKSGNEEEDILPTAEDLQIHNGWMKELTAHGSTHGQSPIFALMDATKKKSMPMQDSSMIMKHSDTSDGDGDGDGDGDAAATTNTIAIATPGEEAREKLDREEQLPLTLYDNDTGAGASAAANANANANVNAFVHVDFTLETFEPERIAVEKVFHTHPTSMYKSLSISSSLSSASASASGEESKQQQQQQQKSEEESKMPSNSTQPQVQVQVQPSAAEMRIQAVITSIDAMNARVAILLDFLHKTRDGTIAPNHALLRQVMSLVRQLPIVKGSISTTSTSTSSSTNGDTDTDGGSNSQYYQRMILQSNRGLEGEFKEGQDDMTCSS